MQLYGVATRAQSVPKGWHVDAWQRRRGECTEYGGFVRIGEFTLCNVVLMVHALQTVSDHGASNSFYMLYDHHTSAYFPVYYFNFIVEAMHIIYADGLKKMPLALCLAVIAGVSLTGSKN